MRDLVVQLVGACPSTTPALPELPKPTKAGHLIASCPVYQDIEVKRIHREAFEAGRAYALAALQPKPAEVSDEEIDALMPEPDGSAEHNCVKVDVGGGITGTEYDEVDAWSAPLVRQTVRAILALRPAQQYPLPDDLYDSKDWRQGDYASRVEWLHRMYEQAKRDRDEFLDRLAAQQATPGPVGEPMARVELMQTGGNALHVNALKDRTERDPLRAEVERLKVDAERYQWLAGCENFYEAICLIANPSLTAHDLGAAIDQARTTHKNEE